MGIYFEGMKMNFYKILLISIILLTLTLGAVSANDNTTSVDDDVKGGLIVSDELISDYEFFICF